MSEIMLIGNFLALLTLAGVIAICKIAARPGVAETIRDHGG